MQFRDGANPQSDFTKPIRVICSNSARFISFYSKISMFSIVILLYIFKMQAFIWKAYALSEPTFDSCKNNITSA